VEKAQCGIRRPVASSSQLTVLSHTYQGHSMFDLANRLRTRDFRQLRYRLTHPVWMGNLRKRAPVTRYGWERGTPIDRHYIEEFLQSNRHDIRGRVLEVMNRTYTEQFGSDVLTSDVIDIDRNNRLATVFADLAAADGIPSESYDCFILTQTLQYIFDLQRAIHHSHRILKPGGVVLATVPGTARLDDYSPDYWRFTRHSCARLFEHVFGAGNVAVVSSGNCVSAIGYLGGLATEDLIASELNRQDSQYPVVMCIRAQKQ